MSSALERVLNHFEESLQVKEASQKLLADPIAQAGKMLIKCLSQGHKILSCGNGGSACDAQHFAAELTVRFEMNRSSLPAIALSAEAAILLAIGNDDTFDTVFARQIEGLGQPGDALLSISTSGQSQNILSAIEMAHQKGMPVLALTGKDGGKIPALLLPQDIEIRVPSNRTARIQEIHILIIHSLCDLIEQQLFSENKIYADI